MFSRIPRDRKNERNYISLSFKPLPFDDTAKSEGCMRPMEGPYARVRYRKTDKEWKDELDLQETILKARHEMELRNLKRTQ